MDLLGGGVLNIAKQGSSNHPFSGRLNVWGAVSSDVFLVFSERRDIGAGEVLERAVTLKVTKLFAF